MVVSAAWPGATSREIEQQVTDKIETKLQELPYFYNVNELHQARRDGDLRLAARRRSAGQGGRPLVPGAQEGRRHPRARLPQGVVGPFFNDEYGDTYSLIWAFEADGFSPAEVKEIVKAVRQRLLRVPDVTKADLFGLQDEKIYIEFSHTRLAMLGVPVDQILDVVRQQNAIVASGTVETKGERVAVRVDGAPTSAERARQPALQRQRPHAHPGRRRRDQARLPGSAADLHALQGQAGDRPRRRHGAGRQRADARQGARQRRWPRSSATCRSASPCIASPTSPRSSTSRSRSSSPRCSRRSAIVLVVSFISLGVRTGIIVALSVPLVLAITFVGMLLLGIDFQRISLGALIIALGLLVDDAIIAVEMMMVKLEQGFSRMEAATYAYTSTAFPMLTGTLVTAVGLRAGGLRQVERRRIHQLDLLGGRPVADHLVVRGRAVHALDRLPPAADAQGPSSRSLRRPALHALPRARRVVRDLAQDHDRHHGARLRRRPWAPSAWCRSSSSRPPTGPS